MTGAILVVVKIYRLKILFLLGALKLVPLNKQFWTTVYVI